MSFSPDTSWSPEFNSHSKKKKQLKSSSSSKKLTSQKVDLGKLSLKKPAKPETGNTDSCSKTSTVIASSIFSSCHKEKPATFLSEEILAANSDDETTGGNNLNGKKSRVQLWVDSAPNLSRENPDYTDLAVPLTKATVLKPLDEEDALTECFNNLKIKAEDRPAANNVTIISSSDDDEAFENFLQNLKKPKKEVKEVLVSSSSFICDDSISDISDEGFYLRPLNERILDRVGESCWSSNKKQVRRSKSEADLKNDLAIYNENPRTSGTNAGMEHAVSDNDIFIKGSAGFDTPRQVLPYRSDISFSEENLLKPLAERVNERTGKKETKTAKTPRKKNKENEPPVPKSSKKDGKWQKSSSSISFLASLSSNVKPELRHEDAHPYVTNFKKHRNDLTQKLFVLFNRQVFDNRIPSDFPVTWNSRLTRTAGYCRHVMKRVDGKTSCESSIELSVKVVDTPCRLRDTLIHELCHAATWMLDECRGGHGPVWRRWANHARSVFPELPPISRCHNYEITYKYRYSCTVCSYSIGRHSKSIDVNTRVCPFCRNGLQLNTGAPENEGSAKKNANKFAMFVKENYAATKAFHAQMSHGEIMKVLSQQFAQVKLETKLCELDLN